MMGEKIVKDGEVEVSSDEPGFEGAWFRAILEDDYPPESSDTRLNVRYLTLVQDDNVSPLMEDVEPKYIRPVPSEDRYNGVVLDQGFMVDAYFKEAWWTGHVLRKLDDWNFSVYFDTPPDIIQFRRNQLRPHLHWNGSDFVLPEIKEVDTSTFSAGSKVEVSTTGVTWYPATIVKVIEEYGEKKFMVKFPKSTPPSSSNDEEDDQNTNATFDSFHVRPVPPPFSVEEYSLMNFVEVRCGSGWNKGSVKAYLGDNSYKVCLESAKEKILFHHSEMRPCKVWENGDWHDGVMPKRVRGTSSNINNMKPRRKSTAKTAAGGTSSKAKTAAATGELRKKRRADVDMNDNTPPPPVTILRMRSRGKESVTHVTPSQVSSVSKRTKSNTRTLEPVRNKNGNDSSQHKRSEDKSRKRKRQEDPKETDGAYDGGSNAEINDTSNHIFNDDDDGLALTPWISVSPNNDDQSQIVSNDATEETQANDSLMFLPFEKTLPLWESYETHEAASSQIPHFRPLFEFQETEQAREWAAYGMTLGFNRLIKQVQDLELDASSSKLRSLCDNLDYLEKQGFDVETPRSRIEKILFFQDVKAKKEKKSRHVDEKMEAENMKIQRVEDEMVELSRKMLELKETKQVAEKMKVEMKSQGETIDQEFEEFELQFKTTWF